MKTPVADGRGITSQRRLQRARLQQAGIWPALLVLLGIAFVVEPLFFGAGNLSNVLTRAAVLGIVTIGQVLVLMMAGIDLSVGAMIGITAVALAEAGAGRYSLTQALIGLVLIAILVGLVNGLLVTKRRVPPVVATFGMFVTLEGARLAYTRGSASGMIPDAILTVGRATVFGVPAPVLAWVALTVALSIGLHRSVLGRRFLLTGSNAAMASLSGISVSRVKIGAYIASALLAMIAGIFFAGDIGYVDRFIGRGMDLDSIAAALLGGATFAGGTGSFVHAAGGALLIIVLMNLILLSGLNVELQFVAKGLVLIAAVALQARATSTDKEH